MKDLQLKVIDPIAHHIKVTDLIKQLNPEMDLEQIEKTQREMVSLPNYQCFGLFHNDQLVGISSAWTTVRFYCGKQLELDNVIIDSTAQSQGLGKYFMEAIRDWAAAHDYKSVSLNTYVQNSRSHKFYFNQGYQVLGFHFEHRMGQHA